MGMIGKIWEFPKTQLSGISSTSSLLCVLDSASASFTRTSFRTEPPRRIFSIVFLSGPPYLDGSDVLNPRSSSRSLAMMPGKERRLLAAAQSPLFVIPIRSAQRK